MVASLALGSLLLAACGGSEGKPTLNWYINPDGQDTLNQLAEDCSTDDYDIAIQLLPASATDQRTQLARLAAVSEEPRPRRRFEKQIDAGREIKKERNARVDARRAPIHLEEVDHNGVGLPLRGPTPTVANLVHPRPCRFN